MDPLAVVLDEVALEGLDGITLSALWTRLRGRQPAFPLSLEPSSTRALLWSFLSSSPDITLHLLPRDRPPLVLHDRFSEVDPNTGMQEVRRLTGDALQVDVYPVSVLLDDPQGIQGSCLYYHERKDVTDLVRSAGTSPKISLEEAQSRWGERLVLVASQEVRYRALIGPEGNPELKLNDHSYCILERLGRARWQGELQRDLHTFCFKVDAGKLHYLRKCLDRNGLITMQTHVVRLVSGAQQHSILLLLKRFHVDRRSKYDLLMEITSNLLSALPNNMGIMIKVREQLNVCERTFKRLYQYMQAAKLVSIHTVPLHEFNPDAGPCKTKKGTHIHVRCLKLLKPYNRKVVTDDEDEDDENDEEGSGAARKGVKAQPREVERDLLAQAYESVVKAGHKGLAQSELRQLLNVGKLEGRIMCRILDRSGLIKGFMQDEGRQRTTKYVSKQFVETSSLNVQFNQEKERIQKHRPPQEDTPTTHEEEEEEEAAGSKGQKSKSKSKRKSKTPKHSTPVRKKPPSSTQRKQAQKTLKEAELSSVEERSHSPAKHDIVTPDHAPSTAPPPPADESVEVVEVFAPDKVQSGRKSGTRHQTYRMLRRKNIIIEAVRSMKVVEGMYILQKKLIDEEKQEGVKEKVCKKSVLRLTQTLAREGYLKIYKTTVIQDGISKKMQLVVDPSIAPDDPLMKSAIEQVRFRISSSYTVHRMKREEEMANAEALQKTKPEKKPSSKCSQSKTEKKMGVKTMKDFKPTIVPGLSRALGFQPKMPRLRLLHTFLWYLVYGHSDARTPAPTPADPGVPDPASVLTPADPEVPAPAPEPGVSAEGQDPEGGAESGAGRAPAEEEQFKVYVDEVSWKRFVPPLPVHREFGYGWALISDVLISLPLSVYVQITQLNYKVDGIEEYLQDPVKQHYLIRFLPSIIKTQLLHRRKYFFSFYDSLQKLCYMGLLQFGPTEKFMERDQGFIYLKKHSTIVDTTACEPHYNLAVGTRLFERRHYTFNGVQDLDNYWFDLMCVCLNTPLGVIRPRSREGGGDREGEESDVTVGPERYERLQYTLKGSSEAVDDGVTPGDGLGAAGLDSTLFTHLKRNWIWTTYLLNKPRKSGDSHAVRLRNLLSKLPLPKSVSTVLQGGTLLGGQGVGGANGALAPPAVVEEEVQVGTELSCRIQQGRGGRKLKRKRQKKVSIKPPKKRRKVVSVKNYTLCQDEIDRRALMLMTRQRVTWTHPEDSILMLCRVASHFLNRKIKKPFVAWNVVRDILHAELELSQDKTSLSVGRRSRHIMKNPQTRLNYRICLAEVYQDKVLVEEFLNRTDNYDDPSVCVKEFKEFMSALRLKFSSSYGSSNVVIPDTKEELFNKFKVYVIEDEPVQRGEDVLNSVEDIHSLVLNNLIQSTLALSNSQMKSCQSFQCFSLYSRYKQKVLLQAFLSCKSRGLVNRRRAINGVAPRNSRTVPFLPMSYQLSQYYYRYFTWRFPNTVYDDAYDLLQQLCVRRGEDRDSTFTFQSEKEPDAVREGDQEEEEEEETMVVFPLEAPGGASLCCLTLLTLGLVSVHVSIPQQIVVVDSTLVDNEVVKSFSKELYEEEDEEGSAGRVEVKARQASHTNYLLMKGFCIPGIMSLRNSNSTEHIAVNSCTIRLQRRATPRDTLFTAHDSTLCDSAPTLPSSFSRVYRSGRGGGRSYEQACVDEMGYTSEDLNAARALRDAVENAGHFGLDRAHLCGSHAHLEEAGPGRSRALHQYIQDLLDVGELVEVGALSPRLVCVDAASPWLLQSPAQECEDGVPPAPPTLSSRAMKRSLDLTDGGKLPPAKRPALETVATDAVVIEKNTSETSSAGSVAVVIVTPDESNAMETSTVKSTASDGVGPKEDDGDEKGGVAKNSPSHDSPASHATRSPAPKESVGQELAGGDVKVAGESSEVNVCGFVSRPWRIVDGSLNRSVCKGMLEAVLLHIMTHPGVPEPALIHHYRDVLQPVVVLDLLQALLELGCVRKRETLLQPKPSLFSRPSTSWVRCEGRVGGTRDGVVFYEPTVDCSLRLARLFPHQDNWSKWVQLSGR